MTQPASTTDDKTTQSTTDTDKSDTDKSTDTTDSTKSTDKPKDDDTTGLKKALSAERKLREEAERKIRDAELAKLPELERAQAEAKVLAEENEKLKTENTRMKLGMELKLPWSIAKRIQGQDENEMREDAKELLADYKVDEVRKDRDAGNRKVTNDTKKTGATSKSDMNTLLRIAAGRGG